MDWKSRLTETREKEEVSGDSTYKTYKTNANITEDDYPLPCIADTTSGKELRVPTNCHPKYHWWSGGQSITDTLIEFNAPKELWLKHVDRITNRKGWDIMNEHFNRKEKL